MQALEGIRVVEMATLLAAPGAAKYLGDYGADVIKVEPPTGDAARTLGWTPEDDPDSYLWKVFGRNKRDVVFDLKTDDGLAAMRALLDTADVLIENMRPGTLERLGLDPEVLHETNPGLVVLRVTGFGQDGPYASRPGFATLAEGMSGLAAISGEPDGAPLLPPIALADEIAALVGAFATLTALRARDNTGRGQTIDVNLLESLLQCMGPLPSGAADRGLEQERLGAGILYTVPRGTYRCADGRWVAVSTSAESVAQRVLSLIGVEDDPRFDGFASRVEHREELDELLGAWIGERDSDDVLVAFTDAHAAIAPVLTMTELMENPHVLERGSMVDVDGVPMPGPVAGLSETPGKIRHAGRPLGADTREVLQELADRAPDAARPDRRG